MSFNPGDTVRLRNDPGRIGTLTGRTRTQFGIVYWQVHFSDGFTFVPEDQLEAGDIPLDPVDLLREGRLSHSRALRRVLTHARLSGRLADVLYSLDATKTDFYAYQFKPILKLLNSVSQGILIADEVGLGKTIEAGLIWTELRRRFEFRRLFVLCPAVLREKWRQELARRFGVRAEVCDAERILEQLQEAASEDLTSRFALIGSMQGMRPWKGWDEESPTGGSPAANRLAAFLDQRQQERPVIDLLIIDEAHHLRNFETATSQLGRLLRGVSDYAVLLSATPVHLRSNDLFQLMRLIDEDTFVNAAEFDEILRANGPLVAARDRVLAGSLTQAEFIELVETARSDPVLRDSRQLATLVSAPPSDGELRDPRNRAELAYGLDQVNLLGQVINRTRKRDVDERRVVRVAVPEAVVLTTVERDFYEQVTEVVRHYCRQRNAHEGFLLTTPQRQMASSIPAAFRYWQEKLRKTDERRESDVEDEDETLASRDNSDGQRDEEGALVRTLVNTVSSLGTFEELRAQDTKYARLREQLKAHLADSPDAKAVLFSSFRATLSYLEERLREDGIPTLTMHGDTEDKDDVIAAFHARSGAVVLLSSEVGSEGVDLQCARVLINYDLPWNPMRVEQRIGRLDRIGQVAQAISIWNLFCADTIDARIHARLYERLKLFERALGGLEAVLGDEIQRLTRDLMSDRLSPEQELRRIDQTAVALETTRRIEEQLEDQASSLIALGDYLLRQVQSARELGRRITDRDLRNYALDFLGQFFPDSELRQSEEDELLFNIRLSVGAKHRLEQYIQRNRLEGFTRLVLSGGGATACRFQNLIVGSEKRGPEVISQFHPLIRFASAELRQQEDDLRLAVAARVSGTALAGKVQPGVYGFAVERWSVAGVQDIERLVFEAQSVDSIAPLHEEDAERLVGTTAIEGGDWLDAPGVVDFPTVAGGAVEQCLGRMRARYLAYVESLEAQNHDRASALLRTLERQVQGQRQRLEEVLDRHETHGRSSLAAATQAKITKLEERAARRKFEIEDASKLKMESRLFLVGVIEVS